MKIYNRPLTVVIIALLYILSGTIGFVYHLINSPSLNIQLLLILFVRIIAVVAGIFVLNRANWARWLLVAWIAFHLIISFWHPIPEIIAHFLFLILTVYCLFQPNAAKYFGEK